MRTIDQHLHIDRVKGKDAETLSMAGVEAGILPTPHILQWMVSAETLFRMWCNYCRRGIKAEGRMENEILKNRYAYFHKPAR